MIVLPKNVYDLMLDHAKSGYPNEACGLLGATTKSSVSSFYPMRNVDQAAVSYFMDPKEQLQVFKTMRSKSEEMVGIFHSHVASEAYPSQKDIRLAFYPEVSYLIVSLTDMDNPILRSYHIIEEKVAEEEIQINFKN